MRFKSIDPFYRHLQQSFPDHLCRIYLVVAENDSDRKDVLLNIQDILSKTATRLCSFLSESSLKEILDEIQAPSLFSQESVVTMDLVENFSEKKKLASYFNLKSGYFLFGCRKKKQLEPMFSAIEKYGVILDLTEEKPWDRKKRLSSILSLRALKEKVAISDRALLELVSCFDDLNVLKQELSKLICYVGEKKRIEKEDVDAVCTKLSSLSSWKIAEELIWRQQGIEKKIELDTKLFQALIYSLRYQLQLGLELSTTKNQDLKKIFPNIWPKTLNFKKQKADLFTESYFKKGLSYLSEIEWASKNSMTCYGLLMDLFYSKLIGLSK